MSPLDYCLQRASKIPYVKGQQRHYAVVTDKGVKLYVVRVNAKGEAVNSKPCRVCEYYIKTKRNIKSIEYTL